MSRKTEPEELYEVTVWNLYGDIVKKLWRASREEADEIEDQYGDDPINIVMIESIS